MQSAKPQGNSKAREGLSQIPPDRNFSHPCSIFYAPHPRLFTMASEDFVIIEHSGRRGSFRSHIKSSQIQMRTRRTAKNQCKRLPSGWHLPSTPLRVVNFESTWEPTPLALEIGSSVRTKLRSGPGPRMLALSGSRGFQEAANLSLQRILSRRFWRRRVIQSCISSFGIP